MGQALVSVPFYLYGFVGIDGKSSTHLQFFVSARQQHVLAAELHYMIYRGPQNYSQPGMGNV